MLSKKSDSSHIKQARFSGWFQKEGKGGFFSGIKCCFVYTVKSWREPTPNHSVAVQLFHSWFRDSFFNSSFPKLDWGNLSFVVIGVSSKNLWSLLCVVLLIFHRRQNQTITDQLCRALSKHFRSRVRGAIYFAVLISISVHPCFMTELCVWQPWNLWTT